MIAPDAATFRAVADPTRRAILDLLLEGARPVKQIAESFPVSRPAISRHLRVLRHAELVEEHRAGRKRIYQLNARPLRAVGQWLEHYRQFWEKKLLSLKKYVEAEDARARLRTKRAKGKPQLSSRGE
jgi:DNA-binding transcriptional ArsR family regulator